MRTFETTGVVTADHTLTVSVPAGACKVVVVVEPTPPPAASTKAKMGFTDDWPAHDVGPWPEGFTASREQLYDDDGR